MQNSIGKMLKMVFSVIRTFYSINDASKMLRKASTGILEEHLMKANLFRTKKSLVIK